MLCMVKNAVRFVFYLIFALIERKDEMVSPRNETRPA